MPMYRLAHAIEVTAEVSVSRWFRDVILQTFDVYELWLGRLFIGLFSLDLLLLLLFPLWSAIINVSVFLLNVCVMVLCQLQFSSRYRCIVCALLCGFSLLSVRPFLYCYYYNRIMNFTIICAHACICWSFFFHFTLSVDGNWWQLITFHKIDKQQ